MANKGDEVIVVFKGDYSDFDKSLPQYEKGVRAAQGTADKASKAMQENQKKTAKEIDNTTKSVSSLKDKLSTLASNLPFANQAKQILDYGKAITDVGTAAKGTSGMMNILRIALASTGILFLIGAISSLIAYFRKTDEGATRLDGAFRAMGVTITVLAEGLIFVGKSIVDAFTDPQAAIKAFGDFLYNQVIVRFNAVIKLSKAAGQAITGDFTKAQKTATDAALELATGVDDVTGKLSKLREDVQDAVKAAYNLAFAYDALEEAERNFSLESANTEREINRLIIASKNRTKTEQERIDLNDKASELETRNLNKSLELAYRRLNLIKQENGIAAGLFTRIQVRSKTISNLDKEEIDRQTKKLELSKQQGQLSDEALDKEAEQIKKIIQLQGSSDSLQEKIQNRRDALLEARLQKELKAFEDNAKNEEQVIKEQAEAGIVNQTEASQQILLIRRDALRRQRELLISNGRDINEINRAISDNYIAYAELEKKARQDVEAEKLKAIDHAYKETLLVIKNAELAGTISVEDAKEVQLNAEIDSLEKRKAIQSEFGQDTIDTEISIADKTLELKKINDDKLKKQDEEAKAALEKKQKEHEAAINALKQGGFQIATQLVDAYFANTKQVRDQDLSVALASTQASADGQLSALTKQKEQGLLTEVSFNAKAEKIKKDQQAKEAVIKRDAFLKDRQAKITQIAIETAVAVAKTLASLPYPASIPLAIVAAATGLAQAAIVQSQPIPKFKKGVIDLNGPGTRTSDSIPSMLSKGESVMTADETRQHKPMFEAIRNRELDKYLDRNVVVPALQEYEVARIKNRERVDRENATALKLISDNATDTTHLERLTKANGNVKSHITNVDQIGESVARKLGNKYVR